LTFTELPTLYSSVTKSSVGLEFVPGKIVEEKVTKVEEAKLTQKEIIAEQVGPSDQKGLEEEVDEEEVDEKEIQLPPQPIIQVSKEEQVIKEQFETAVAAAADYEVIEKQEQQSEKIDQLLKQWVVYKTKAEINLKKAEDDFNTSKSIFSFGDESLQKIVKENQNEMLISKL
jgi:hypothetical protein